MLLTYFNKQPMEQLDSGKNLNIVFRSGIGNILEDTKMSSEEFIEAIEHKLPSILQKAFPKEAEKRTIHKFHNRINFACPFCGDSSQFNSKKKRGNIILSGEFANRYKCFNCQTIMSIDDFFKDLDVDMSVSELSYVSEVKKTQKVFKISKTNEHASKLLMPTDLQGNVSDYLIDVQSLLATNYITTISNAPSAYKYLTSRNHLDHSHFLYDMKHDALLILNRDKDGKVLGMQSKSLRGKRFLTYKLSSIYRDILNVEPLPIIEEHFDKLSGIYNILTVDYNAPIIVMEGAMDAFLLDNSIATSSATISPPNLVKYYYMYDDDKTGQEQAMKRLSSGEYVFKWSEFKDDYNLPKRSKWDYNDVVNYLKDNNIKVPKKYEIMKYFTNDILDTLYV